MRLYGVRTIEPASALPVTVAEFVDHARLNGITVDRQPDLVERELRAATERTEKFLRRSIMRQTLEAAYVPDAPKCSASRALVLPRGPVESVTTITNGGVIDPETYTLQWNVITLQAPLYGATVVRFVSAGYGETADSVPSLVKEGILELATVLYQSRSGERDSKYESGAQGIPPGVRDLLRSEQIELSG